MELSQEMCKSSNGFIVLIITFPWIALILIIIENLTNFFLIFFSGGVYPPGIAFAKTQLIEELVQNIPDLKFEVVKS